MNKKELITELVKAGFTIEEALKTAADPLEETEQVPAAADPAGTQPEPEAAADPAPENTQDLNSVLQAIDELKKAVSSMTEVTRATARLYSAGEKKTESADDILAQLG